MNKAFLLCFLVIGCYTPKKALKQLNKAYNEHPEVVSKFADDKFPNTIAKIDTIITFDTGYVFVPEYIEKTDTIIDTITKSKVVVKQVDKIKVVTKVVTITKVVVDSAKVSDLSYQLSKVKADYEHIKESRSNYIFWLLIALCCSLFANLVIYILK
jgi:hypothetical protein